jgi:hypothetical protein
LSHRTCSYIRMYINAVADSVMLCLQHDLYNIIFKIEHKLYIASALSPPRKNMGCVSASEYIGCAKNTWRFLKVRRVCHAVLPILTIIMYSGVWSFVGGALVIQHCIGAVELFIKTEPVTSTQRGFWQQFQRCDAPSHNTVLLWVSNWCPEGLVKDCKPQRCPCSAHTPDSVEQVRDRILWSPFRCDCSGILNDMGATYKVPYSNSNDSDEFSWTWNVPASVHKTFPLGLKMLFHVKNR